MAEQVCRAHSCEAEWKVTSSPQGEGEPGGRFLKDSKSKVTSVRSLQVSLLTLGTQLTWAAALQGVESISTSFSSSSCTQVARMGTLWGSATLAPRALLPHLLGGHTANPSWGVCLAPPGTVMPNGPRMHILSTKSSVPPQDTPVSFPKSYACKHLLEGLHGTKSHCRSPHCNEWLPKGELRRGFALAGSQRSQGVARGRGRAGPYRWCSVLGPKFSLMLRCRWMAR